VGSALHTRLIYGTTPRGEKFTAEHFANNTLAELINLGDVFAMNKTKGKTARAGVCVCASLENPEFSSISCPGNLNSLDEKSSTRKEKINNLTITL
jgi:hypothetical protein